MRPLAGERRGRRQLGKSSHWSAGVTWCRGGCWKVDRDASGAGLSFAEYADSAGITWQPKQYVLTKSTFFRTIADLLVSTLATTTDSAPVSPSCSAPVLFPSCLSSFFLMFFYLSCQDCCLLKYKRTWGRRQITLLNTSTNPNKRYVTVIARSVPPIQLPHSLNLLAHSAKTGWKRLMQRGASLQRCVIFTSSTVHYPGFVSSVYRTSVSHLNSRLKSAEETWWITLVHL